LTLVNDEQNEGRGNSVYEQNTSSFGLQECLQILTTNSTMCWNSRHSAI